MFARETGQDISYERILAPVDRFVETAREFRRGGGKGINVTVPFKMEAYGMAEERSERAFSGGSVNTLTWYPKYCYGDNTDGVGLIRDIEFNLRIPLAGTKILLLGAGGAARGVAGELLRAKPAGLWIANRTERKAIDAAHAASPAGRMTVLPIADLSRHQFDIVINATSASMHGELPSLPPSCFGPGALGYDMVYGRDTPFLTLAANAGARTADGLGMLVEQAAEAFYIWRGLRPSTAPVLAHLRNELQAK
jgi:shikimate dehydrogenase